MNRIEFGDCRQIMKNWAFADVQVQTCVTSPPYFGLRNYGVEGQLGLEGTPQEYIDSVVEVFRGVKELLRDDGTLWLNLGDSYSNTGKWGGSTGGKHVKGLHGGSGVGRGERESGLKPKELIGIPWRVAFALQADGWYLRQDIIWHKTNPMPESVRDRCTKAHEYIFLFSKSPKYYFDCDAIKTDPKESSVKRLAQDVEAQAGSDRVPGKTNGPMKAVYGGRNKKDGYGTRIHSGNEDNQEYLQNGVNKRSVWMLGATPYKGAHFATYPPALIEPCVLAGAPAGGIVLDPFMGSGTTAYVALKNGRRYLGCELNPEYGVLQQERIIKGMRERFI